MDADRGYRATMIKGAYQLRLIDSGKCISDTGEVRNLILNEALNHGDPFSSGFICVGDGDSEPYSTQVALDNQLGQVSGTFSSDATIFMDGQDRYARRSVTVSFTGLVGDIREVGFRRLAEGDLLSRTLIRDGNGYQTWVPIQAHQTLEVTFFVYFLVPDVLDTGEITTQFGQSVNYTARPSDDLSSPKGILAGRYDNPVGTSAGNSFEMLKSSGEDRSTTVTINYNSESQECELIVNWSAQAENRIITGFRAFEYPDSHFIVELSEPLTLPADHDITLTFNFAWSIS